MNLGQSAHIDALFGLVGAVIGAAVGGAVPLWWASHARKNAVNGELAAMLAELNTVHSTVTTLLTDRFEAPLYSLPNSSFGQFLPRQIGESIYVDNEIRTLLEYQRRVEELNRGLERARDAHARQQEIRRIEEFGRNQKKAEALISEGGPTAPWALAKEAIERARGLAQQKRRAWRRRFHLKR